MIKELTMEKTSLPVGWEIKKIPEISEDYDRKRVPITKSKRIAGNIPYYGASGIVDYVEGFLFNEDLLLVSEDGANLLARKYPIAFSISGKTWVNNHAHILKFEDSVTQKFTELYLNSIKLDNFISGMAQPKLNKTKLNSIPIPIPPLPQQKQIVATLEKAFAAIDTAKANAEQNLQNAKELFESYLQNVFSTKGDDWEEKQIKDLTELVTKGSSPKWQGVNYVDEGGIFFLTSKNVGEGELLLNNKKYLEEKFNKIQKTSILKKGDVLTNIVGASIGRTAIFNLDEITNINQAVCLMRCDSEKVYNYYLMYLLNSPFFKNILHENEVDNARANLSLTFFKNLAIPLPKLSEQKEIVENIKSFSTETKKLEAIYTQKIVDLEEMKKSVLQKAFSGQLNTIN
jgi:type I restriction enzyme S subunit